MHNPQMKCRMVTGSTRSEGHKVCMPSRMMVKHEQKQTSKQADHYCSCATCFGAASRPRLGIYGASRFANNKRATRLQPNIKHHHMRLACKWTLCEADRVIWVQGLLFRFTVLLYIPII